MTYFEGEEATAPTGTDASTEGETKEGEDKDGE